MKKITRNIDLVDARDLLERIPRACVSFACDHGPQTLPVVFVWHDGHYLIGLPTNAKHLPGPNQEIVLLIDEGVYFFDLRAIYIRGHAKLAEAPAGAVAGCTWFEVAPLKTVAWDYGTLHEVNDEN